MANQFTDNNNKLIELLSRVSAKDIEIISSHVLESGNKRIFIELCKSNPSFWNGFMHELSKHDNIKFDDAMVGAQLALGILARRAKIDYLNETLIDIAKSANTSGAAVASELSG